MSVKYKMYENQNLENHFFLSEIRWDTDKKKIIVYEHFISDTNELYSKISF